jgi:hypothetical protein
MVRAPDKETLPEDEKYGQSPDRHLPVVWFVNPPFIETLDPKLPACQLTPPVPLSEFA